MLANPYALLAALLGALAMFGAGVSVGYKWEKNAHLATLAVEKDKAVERANQDAEAEKQRALAAAKAEADARLAARTIRMKVELDAAKKARPECARDAESHGLLVDSIRLANGEKDTAVKLPDAVRPDANAPDRFRSGRSELGISSGGCIRPLSPPSR